MTAFAIRAERLEDLESIREVNRLAFGQDAEARLVDRLRADGLVVSSLVATEGPRVIGHLLFSELPIETDSAVIRGAALAPMSVIPSHQRQGIGSSLVREGLEECRRGGVAVVVVLGQAEKFAVSEGFDGQAAWAQGMNGNVNNLPEPDQQRAKRTADFYEVLDLAKNYERMEVIGTEKVNNRDAYVVLAYAQNDSPERLYFDTKTGLLLRRLTTLPSSLGPFPYAVDYDDYKKTSKGVMFPFVIRTNPSNPRNEAATNSTIQILQVRENVVIDPSKFAKPTPKIPPGQPVTGISPGNATPR